MDEAMVSQVMINWILGVFGLVIGIMIRGVWQAVKDLQDSDKKIISHVNALEVLVAGNYVKHDELDKLSEAIFKKLDRIEDKLDGKADKD